MPYSNKKYEFSDKYALADRHV